MGITIRKLHDNTKTPRRKILRKHVQNVLDKPKTQLKQLTDQPKELKYLKVAINLVTYASTRYLQ